MENKSKKQGILHKGGQWLRVGILTLTTLGPIVSTLLARMRQQGADNGNQQMVLVKGKIQEARQPALQRLEKLTAASRQQAAEQAQQLSAQAQQLQMQAAQLRKALRKEAKQRTKMAKQMRKTGLKWSQDVLKRGGNLTEDLVEQSAKLSQDLKERGEQITEDIREGAGTLTQKLSKRTGQVAQDLSERGSQITQKISKRTSQVAQDFSGRGGVPIQKRGRLLSIIGFSAGCALAAITTFIIVRRLVEQNSEQDQQIELPLSNAANGAVPQEQSAIEDEEMGQQEGEIVILNADGTIVTIIQPESEGE